MSDEAELQTAAFGLARFAKEYLEAAVLVDSQMSVRRLLSHTQSPPAVFLLAHGLEITLKAFLLYKGLSPQVLKTKAFGHNLRSLRREAKRNGLDELYRGTAAQLKAFLILDALNTRHQQRYVETGVTVALPWDEAEEYAVTLHQRLAKKLGSITLERVYPVERGLNRY